MIKIADIVRLAARRGMLRYIEKFVQEHDMPAKDWPKYVKNEIFKHIPIAVGTPKSLPVKPGVTPSLSHYKPILEEFMWDYGSAPQTLTLKTNMSNFDRETQGDLHVRMTKEVNVQDDTKRHEFQRGLFKGQKELINEEPVVVKQVAVGKYKLLEGWHRTAQLFSEARRRGLDKVKFKAYVGKKGVGQTIDYYLKELGKYMQNVPVKEDQSQFKKKPYREVMKSLKEKGQITKA